MDSQRVVPRTASLPLVVDQRLLKEELRMTIMAKRHARGQGKISVEFREPERRELSQSEVERKERRREQNRRAAQRCRRKKRLNQMSVLQNYDWILSRNQQLVQEVETLRQDRDHLQSTLKAHFETCQCAHVQKPHVHLLGGKVKMEPREDSPTLQMGYPSPTPSSAASVSPIPMACQYGGTTDTPAASCAYNPSFQPVPYPNQRVQSGPCDGGAFISCPQEHSHDLPRHCGQNFLPVHVDTRCSPTSRPVVSSTHSPLAHSPHHTSAPTSAGVATAGPNQSPPLPPYPFVPSPISSSSYTSSATSITDEQALLRMSRMCLFQEEVATPLSNDGRHSISSVCSDLSTASEQHSDVSTMPEGRSGVVMGDFAGSDMATDVSDLLSQISREELFFPRDSHALDDVFSDPENFLQNIISEN